MRFVVPVLLAASVFGSACGSSSPAVETAAEPARLAAPDEAAAASSTTAPVERSVEPSASEEDTAGDPGGLVLASGDEPCDVLLEAVLPIVDEHGERWLGAHALSDSLTDLTGQPQVICDDSEHLPGAEPTVIIAVVPATMSAGSPPEATTTTSALPVDVPDPLPTTTVEPVLPAYTLEVHTDGCGVFRSGSIGDDVNWSIKDLDGFEVLGRVAAGETQYRYFRSGTYTVTLETWGPGYYVDVSNQVTINC